MVSTLSRILGVVRLTGWKSRGEDEEEEEEEDRHLLKRGKLIPRHFKDVELILTINPSTHLQSSTKHHLRQLHCGALVRAPKQTRVSD